jgi:hypothetical protein
MPFSLTYSSDEGMIASYGYYATKKEASDAAIRAVKDNPTLLLSNFYISERKVKDKPFTENLTTLSLKKYKVYVQTHSLALPDYIGEYNTKEEANAAIINDMLSKHPGYTIDQYFVKKKIKNII